MQSVGHLVEFGEAGGHAARDAAVGGDRVDLVHRRLQQVLERNEVLRRAALRDVVDFRLRTVDDLGHIGTLGAGIAVLHDPRSGLHKPAQQRLLGHDARVVARVRGGRHRGDQGVQIRCSTDPAQQPAAVQLGRHRHRVGGLPAPVQVQDRVVDVLVCRAIEVAGPQPFEDIGDGVLAQQHPAQHRLLGGHILRWLTAEFLAGRRSVHASRYVIDDRHRLPPPSAS